MSHLTGVSSFRTRAGYMYLKEWSAAPDRLQVGVAMPEKLTMCLRMGVSGQSPGQLINHG